MRSVVRARLSLAPALLALALVACNRPPGEPSAAPPPARVPVSVATVEARPMPVELTAVGNVVASETVAVRPQITGRMARVHFREGEDVAAGQLLFTLDARELDAQLRQAEANLAREQAVAENARREAERYRTLASRGFVSQSQAEQIIANAAAAAATAAAARAAVQNARVEVARTRIAAPIPGRAGRVLVDVGNVVRANETDLVVINRLHPIEVSFAVPGQHLAAIQAARRSGRPLEVVARPSADATPARGRLTFVDNRVDPQTGTLLLQGTFVNEDGRLWPGAFATTTLILGIDENALVVPAPAVQSGQQGTYVFVVRNDQTVEPRTVAVARQAGDVAIIAEGLRAGERVVTEGQLRLAPGVAVQVTPSPSEGMASPRS
jgi:multidrug efflux system membrane fusion protein